MVNPPPPLPPPPPPLYYWNGTPGQSQPAPPTYQYGYSYGGYNSSTNNNNGTAGPRYSTSMSYNMLSVPGAAPRNAHPYMQQSNQQQQLESQTITTNGPYGTVTSTTTTMTTNDNNIVKAETRWVCDSCDITLDSERAFKSHRKSHVQCTECTFEGVQKVVKAHYQANHGKFAGSGFKTVTVSIPGCRVQKFKICVGNRPEDIQRWIAERKKRFPRSSSSSSNNNNNNNSNTNNNNNNDDDDDTATGSNHATKRSVSAISDSVNKKNETSASNGLSALLAGYGSDSDSESDAQPVSQSEVTPPPVIASKTPQTMDDDISDTNPTSDPQESPLATASPSKNQTPPRRVCRFFFRNGSCRNGDSCRFSHQQIPPSRPETRPASSQHNNNIDNNNNNNKIKTNMDRKRKRGGHTSSDTLLRKLLENDMDRESTLTLQLLKYIVRNDFFDGTVTTAVAATTGSNGGGEEK
ncbi:zinc finger domain containing protein [Nitzschia inconspicua]|uniref:Zinc finger domain containing protein n=1 Tax=Nitzschia inconspicua TaxID=303405 RepID=A0A9K3PSE1_9STRA|nr:zinc finger domain containing protein [Nitzschia inconspicua]